MHSRLSLLAAAKGENVDCMGGGWLFTALGFDESSDNHPPSTDEHKHKGGELTVGRCKDDGPLSSNVGEKRKKKGDCHIPDNKRSLLHTSTISNLGIQGAKPDSAGVG